ncbi:MAG: transporter substrate-binding domain-containing protein [Alphaproteobacteria bacterium]|nr:transporter substrate-binding domain-containing protein [Alphaproteobacteria bacterium]
MNKIFTFMLLMLLSFPALAADTESAYDRVMRTGVIKCGYYPWPPYFDVDANTGDVTGLNAEYARAAGDLLGLKIEFVQMSAIGMQVEELKKGIYDTFCIDSYYVFSSLKFVDFGTPYMFAPVFAYVREDDNRFKSLDDLNQDNIQFVGIDGDLSVELVAKRFPNAQVTTLPATAAGSELMINVSTKKADVSIIDPGIVDAYNSNNQSKMKIVDPDHPVAVYPISFSVKKGETELLKMLDGAVSALQNTGVTENILKKYNLPADSVYLPATPYKK